MDRKTPLKSAAMIRWTVMVFPILLIFGTVLHPDKANAHGAVEMKDDICVRRVGGNMVHFSAYQPQISPKAQYCTEIPDEGETFLVVDLVDPVLRDKPIGVRIVRGEDEADSTQIVADWQAVSHPDGVIRGEAVLEKGLYKFIITAEGLSPYTYLLRVQQFDFSKIGRNAVGPLALLLILAIVGYELSKSRRIRNWWGSRRA